MDLLGKKLLDDFKQKHKEACSQIDSWIAEIEEAQWETPSDLKRRYPKASLLKGQYVVFDICWNKYRLLVQISYKTKKVLVEKIGTHKEYNNWNLK